MLSKEELSFVSRCGRLGRRLRGRLSATEYGQPVGDQYYVFETLRSASKVNSS